MTTSAIAHKSQESYQGRTGVVTMLDVLGWKGIYLREANPINVLERLIERLSADDLTRGLVSEVDLKSISDTIVLFSVVEEDDAVAAIEAHGAICGEAIAHSIAAHIPVRGATSYGDFQARKNVYVGRAIDEAAAWHEMAEWIGVHLTPSASLMVDRQLDNWVDYEPPLKRGLRCNTHCVRWIRNWQSVSDDDEALHKLRSTFRSMGPLVPEIAPKFENTRKFAEEQLEAIRVAQEAETS